MSDEVFIVTPEVTPGTGGVGDYTLRLAEYLPQRERVRLLVTSGDLKGVPGDGRVLVQYSAYGFDQLGYPRKLIQALIDWRNRSHGRLVLMFHEIWTFWPITDKNFFVQFLHRMAIKRLLAHTDAAFTSTPSQAVYLRGLSARIPIQLLPVGTNILPKSGTGLPRRAGLAVLFGRGHSRLHALKKMRASLNALATAGKITRLVTVGADASSEVQQEERELLASLPLSEGFDQLGSQSEEIISETLSSASFGIFGQDGRSYGKSGTFMTYCAHKLNILADCADTSKPEPIGWLVSPREVIEGISESELKTRADDLFSWQQRVASWDRIAARVAEALDLKPSERASAPVHQ